jgi:hypothetical protein
MVDIPQHGAQAIPWGETIAKEEASSLKERMLSAVEIVLITQNESFCQSLAMALMQVASSISSNHNRGKPLWCSGNTSCSPDHKVVEALERTMERWKTKSSTRRAKRRLVHVVETVQKHSPLIANASHAVVVLSTEDILTWYAQEAAKLALTTERKFKPLPADQHPLVQECLSSLPNPTDTILLQKISIVLLIRQVEDAETVDFLASTLKPNKKTLCIQSFVCRPDEPSSCQTVARMLWNRLDKSVDPDESPAGRILRSANP